MKTLELFIKAKWHTVPLKGKLERMGDGKKTLPVFEKDWRKKYTAEFNEEVTEVAGAITGIVSGIVAVDCDNEATYELFKAFDPDYSFHFISKGKATGGGTIIYAYDSEVGSFKLANDEIKLDFFSDDGFVYLPTEGNKTKESWSDIKKLPELKPMPAGVKMMLKALKSKTISTGVVKDNERKHNISNRLAPLLENFVAKKKYDPILFKVLTPYSFRDLPAYVTKGHLHPNDIPKGRGSEYLMKLSAILGADISVNSELYTNSMMLVFGMGERFKHWDKARLMATVINPMLEERSMVDGQVIWQYDPHWEQMGFIATAINGDYIESFYDDTKGIYFLINYTVPYIKTYSDKTALIKTIKALLGRSITENQYDSVKQLTRTFLNPALEFGHIEGSDMFNLFRQSPELSVLNNPGPYKDQYKRPNATIAYFESLIPDDFMRSYVLSFMKTKLTTFKYSPVILYMIGKPGSGKDTFVNIMRTILGQEYVAKPDTKVFLEQYNGWLIDKYVIQLDEYGNKLIRATDKQEVLGKLKAYTGSEDLQIRAMRNDGYNAKHCITFVMTANSNPLPVETEDRRVCYIKTPNILAKQDWVLKAGGIVQVIDQIKAEVMDFCYYLATEVDVLKMDDYVIAPETEDKENLILSAMPAAEQIAYYIQNERFEELKELAFEYGVMDFCNGWENNRIEDEALAELYERMTDGNGNYRVVIRQMKGMNINRSHTTKNKENTFYYFIPNLHKFAQPDFETQEGEDIKPERKIKGLNSE